MQPLLITDDPSTASSVRAFPIADPEHPPFTVVASSTSSMIAASGRPAAAAAAVEIGEVEEDVLLFFS